MNYITNILFGWMGFEVPVKKRTDNVFEENIYFRLSNIEDVFDILVEMCLNYYNQGMSAYQFNCEGKYVTIIFSKREVLFLIDEDCLNVYIGKDNTKVFIKKLYEDLSNNVDELIYFNSNNYNFSEDEDETAYIKEINDYKEHIDKKLKELSLLIDKI